ncbi:MAG: hypothetical protein GXP43_01335 [bacterium]|nr:hypothetical protein [bacterium]
MIIAKYPYRLWSGSYLPMIPVSFSRHPNKDFINTFCLIDSGAFTTALSSQFANALNINIKKGTPRSIATAGGDSIAYEHKLYLKIKNHTITLKALFSDKLNINIIGRQDFFDHFLIIFRQSKKQLWLIG